MKKKILLLGILAILISVGLSGCNHISNLFLSDDDKLIGIWDSDGAWLVEVETPAVITFSSNGTIKIDIEMGPIDYTSEGTWDMNEGILSIEIEDILPLTEYRYQFLQDNTILTLTNINTDVSFTLTKQ